MTIHLRIAAATAALALGSSASAHEFTCEQAVGLVALDAEGAPLDDGDGAPVFTAGPMPILRVSSYPAAIAFRVRLTNVADAFSLVTGLSGPLGDAALAGAVVFGTTLGAGLSLPPGATSDTYFVVPVDTFEACQALAGGRGEAPQCTPASGDHAFTVSYPTGSAECRARVVCQPAVAP